MIVVVDCSMSAALHTQISNFFSCGYYACELSEANLSRILLQQNATFDRAFRQNTGAFEICLDSSDKYVAEAGCGAVRSVLL